MEDYEKEMKKLFIKFAISVDETELYCPNKWMLLNRKIKTLFMNPTNKELEAERDALQATVKQLEAELEEERQENASLRSGSIDDYERGAE